MLDLWFTFFQTDWNDKLCVSVCACVCVSSLNLLYVFIVWKHIWANNKSFLYIFSPFFFFFVNYSFNLDEDTLHRNTVAVRKRTNHDRQWKVYLRCCVRFSTSSGCLKSGAFFSVYLGGWVWECEAFNVHIKPRSHTCLIVVSPFPIRPLVSFYSLRCGVHPHGTRPFTSSVYAYLLSLCETIFKVFFVVFFFSIKVVVRDCNI